MSYSTSLNLIVRFGLANVTKWSDLTGAGTLDTDRVASAIAYADARIDLLLNGGPYTLPLVFAGTTAAQTIQQAQDWSVVLAGHWLYFSRGLLDKDEQGPKLDDLKKGVEDDLTAARSGRIRLGAQRRWAPNPNAPSAM